MNFSRVRNLALVGAACLIVSALIKPWATVWNLSAELGEVFQGDGEIIAALGAIALVVALLGHFLKRKLFSIGIGIVGILTLADLGLFWLFHHSDGTQIIYHYEFAVYLTGIGAILLIASVIAAGFIPQAEKESKE